MFALLGCSFALPVDEREKAPVVEILSSTLDHNPEGGYDAQYEGADGTRRNEQGEIKNKGTDDEALEVHGSYTYINDQGEEVVVTYTAGVNGFVPQSTIIHPKITEVAAAAQYLPREEPEIKA